MKEISLEEFKSIQAQKPKKMKKLKKIKEFTKITMKGENGVEKESHFNFDTDKEIVALIRKNIEQFLKTDIAKGTDELNAL